MRNRIRLIFFFLLLFTGRCIAQPGSYESRWKKIEALEEKGLTASARHEARLILKQAVRSGITDQQIKAVVYLLRYSQYEENSANRNLLFLDSQINRSKLPAKNILYSLKASFLEREYQINQYKILSRTPVEGKAGNDINTWDARIFEKKITESFMRSLDDPAGIRSVPVSKYEQIIAKGSNTRHLRPTLYDLLAHQALVYFSEERSNLSQPADRFVINDERAFASPAIFVRLKFSSKDSSSHAYRAIILLQQLTLFHLSDKKPDALADINLIRLEFVYKKGVFESKDKLYEQALFKMEEDAGLKNLAHRPKFLRAQLYFDQGQSYDPVIRKNTKWNYSRSLKLCDSVISQYPKSEGAVYAQNLRNQLIQPELNIQSEAAYIPSKPVKYLIKYKNLKEVSLKIVRISYEKLYEITRNENDGLKQEILALPAVWSKKISLPGTDDLREHSTEYLAEPLTQGVYLLIASSDPSFSLVNNILTRQSICISSISYLRDENDFYVVDRETGNPLAGARVKIWLESYNSDLRRYEEVLSEENYTTDANGSFKVNASGQYRNIIPDISWGNDRLKSLSQEYAGPGDRVSPGPSMTSFLFTDRSIYRPGQTVYFKGILLNTDQRNRKFETVAGKTTSIQLRNANYEPVSKIQLISGKFGSYDGSFTLPEGALNGQFSIQDSLTGSVLFFNVEDYKRPKFRVVLNEPQGIYRVNDSVTIKGNAIAYTGNSINDGKIVYRVKRKTWFPYPVFYRRSIWPPMGGKEMEITNGVSVTDSKGEFAIRFKAIPDESIGKETGPVFYYEVTADVTDINGETRSAQQVTAVSYKALKLNIDVNEQIPADSLSRLRIFSSNLQGTNLSGPATIRISKIDPPQKFLRKRYWEDPDMFIITKEEHDKLFPDDPYDKEYLKEMWPVSSIVTVISANTQPDGHFPIAVSTEGWLKIEASSVDKYGDTAYDEKIIFAFRNWEDQSPEEAAAILTPTTSIEPAGIAGYAVKTRLNRINPIFKELSANGNKKTSFPVISRRIPVRTNLLVTEEDRGGINLSIAFIHNNRLYKSSGTIEVPWTNKELFIRYESFRDKLLPGSSEKWKIKISGSKGEKIAAELLASMYDASLDQFRDHSWQNLRRFWVTNTHLPSWHSNDLRMNGAEKWSFIDYPAYLEYKKSYDRLITPESGYGFMMAGAVAMAAPEMAADAAVVKESAKPREEGESKEKEKLPEVSTAVKAAENISVRKNLNETAFFFPRLHTDSAGSIEFNFTVTEALTEWKLMLLAHTTGLASGYSEKRIITSKPLMIQANAPRFFREGDHMELPAKISCSDTGELTGKAYLELFDPATGNGVDGWFKNVFPVQYFTVSKDQSESIFFPIDIPFNYSGLLGVRVKAETGDGIFSDGEEIILPVLSNRILVTESLPVYIGNEKSRSFKFEKLLASGASPTSTNISLTAEFTSNPAWYAVQALPYLMENEFECADAYFSRYYANTLASFIAASNPRINEVFKEWLKGDSSVLLSSLEKNQELKSVILEETPWVQDAKNETESKKQIGILFDQDRISRENKKVFDKLRELQLSNGGFSWFKGFPDDRYITQQILTGMGHLRHLRALQQQDNVNTREIIKKAVIYSDERIVEEYENLKRLKTDLNKNNLSPYAVQYLYMRSFFPEIQPGKEIQKVYDYYLKQAEIYWLQNNLYMQGMIALAIHRKNDQSTIPSRIIASLKEKAIISEELGMYWKELTTAGYYWYQAPVESQSLMIEVFREIESKETTVQKLQLWLLRNKQTNRWRSSRSTADACYALLYGSKSLNGSTDNIVFRLGEKVMESKATEAGTGYFKSVIMGEKVKPELGHIEIRKRKDEDKGGMPGWGAVYWQYLEDADKISSSATNLRIDKKLFRERLTDRGPELKALRDGEEPGIGDKLVVRIEIRTDRDMEYVHMKDMRASCTEPINVLSGYKYRGGLGYYESTRDASTHFFFSYLPKGTYVFEYPLYVSQAGQFSNGITSIQCMYAPEFSSHSEGQRISVKQP